MNENIYRRPASPEVDAAWEALGVNCEQDYILSHPRPRKTILTKADRSLVIPESQAKQAGFRQDQVKINPKHGGGFPANVEGLHHLHCLNLVRQALWYNFDYYRALGQGAFKNEEMIVRLHVCECARSSGTWILADVDTAHCVDILRQQLMCKPDLGFLGQVWYNTSSPSPFVDFNTQHRCRNYQSLRQWAEVRQLPEKVAADFLQPPNAGDLIYDEIP